MKKLSMLFTLCATALLSTTALAVSPLDKDGNLNISGLDFSQGMITPYSYTQQPFEKYASVSSGNVTWNGEGDARFPDCTTWGYPYCSTKYSSHSFVLPSTYYISSTTHTHPPYYNIDGYSFDSHMQSFGGLGRASYSANTFRPTGEIMWRVQCTNSSYEHESGDSWTHYCRMAWVGPRYTTCVVSGSESVYYSSVVPEFTPTAIKLKNCRFSPHDGINTFPGSSSNIPIMIDGGQWEGAPAINNNSITIKRGEIKNTTATSSVYQVDPDSTATTVPFGNNGGTITTVKLTNPPIIIDWGEFPGLDIDLSAPTIFLTSSGRGYTMQSKTLCRYCARMK